MKKNLAIGIDLISIKEFKKSMKTKTFLTKVFTRNESANRNPESLAGIFAAKEAVIKALALPSNFWQNIEIDKEKNGRPFLRLSPAIQEKIYDADLSITHQNGMAIAAVVAQIRQDDDKKL